MRQINAAKILLLFPNRKAYDWTSLQRALEKEIGFYSLERGLPTVVDQLLQANLLAAENPDYLLRNSKFQFSQSG